MTQIQREVVEAELQRYAEYLNHFGLTTFVWDSIEDIESLRQTTILQARSLFEGLRNPPRQSSSQVSRIGDPIVRAENSPGIIDAITPRRQHFAAADDRPIPFPVQMRSRRRNLSTGSELGSESLEVMPSPCVGRGHQRGGSL